jgi:putative ABC transport system ATP-binding protein
MTHLLQVENVAKSFFCRGNELKILNGISFVVDAGELFLISGRSGTGKSTLLNLLAGLERATSGRIVFNEQLITDMSMAGLAELRATSIDMIFQNFNLVPGWSAIENVEAVLMHRGISRNERLERTTAILTELGLGDRLHNLPAELSVGQQQRVAIARTLVNEPALILADEPTGDVDAETADEILSLLLPRIRSGRTAMIVASHGLFNPALATRTACSETESCICDMSDLLTCALRELKKRKLRTLAGLSGFFLGCLLVTAMILMMQYDLQAKNAVVNYMGSKFLAYAPVNLVDGGEQTARPLDPVNEGFFTEPTVVTRLLPANLAASIAAVPEVGAVTPFCLTFQVVRTDMC